MTARFNYLSEDLISEILSWLPADSLTRFKCVRKSWYSLIEDHQFVTKQLHNHVRSASDDNLCILLRRWIPSDTQDENFENILSLLTHDSKMQATSGGDDFSFLDKTLNLQFYNYVPSLEILGSCDGIVCFYDRNSIVIANPGIREFRFLPESCVWLPPHPPNDDDDNVDHLLKYYTDTVGLGFDPEANDYKVVRLWTIDNSSGPVGRKLEVYSLSNDSWREIDNFVMEEVEIDSLIMNVNIIDFPYFERYWNGAYYWYAEANCTLSEGGSSVKKRKSLIAVFDLTYEMFRYIVIPEPCDDHLDLDVYTAITLVEFNGSLALFHYPFEQEEKTFDIWTMDEFGVNGIWTKILSIGPVSGIWRPLLFVKSDLLLMESAEGQMVSYNLKTNQVKGFPLYGEKHHLQAVVYKRSLLSIHGRNRVDNYRVCLDYKFLE